jgi:hypothetical protein
VLDYKVVDLDGKESDAVGSGSWEVLRLSVVFADFRVTEQILLASGEKECNNK